MDNFNRVFQKSSENTTYMLFSETCRLLWLYPSNLLKIDVIVAAGDDLKGLWLDRRGQLTDENLGIRVATWSCLMDPFSLLSKSFYCETIRKMQRKFPFHDLLMKDLSIPQPENTAHFSVSSVLSLAKRFRQLGLAEDHIMDQLREEFTISNSDLPYLCMYKGSDKPRSGPFWSKVGEMKKFDGEPRFGLLLKLMSGLHLIPCSNADSERGFSMLHKIHTD